MSEDDKGALEPVSYTPIGSEVEILLDAREMCEHLSPKGHHSRQPTRREVKQMFGLCASRLLDPYAGDVYWIFDNGRLQPCVTYHALAVRADLHEDFQGIRSGLITTLKDSNTGLLDYTEGSIYIEEHYRIVGAWANGYRKSWKKPRKISMRLASRIQDTMFWKKDPGGMIIKCCEAALYRAMFPSVCGGCYIRSEMFTSKPNAPIGVSKKKSELINV